MNNIKLYYKHKKYNYRIDNIIKKNNKLIIKNNNNNKKF